MRKSSKNLRSNSQFLRFQNQVRGSGRPLALVSSLRSQIAKEDLDSFVQWTRKTKVGGKQIYFNLMPKSVADLRKLPLFTPVSATREVEWAAAFIRAHTDILNPFIQLGLEYERYFVQSKFEECADLLEAIEREYGASIWLITTRVALLQTAFGLEAQKKYVSEVRSLRQPNDVVAFLAHWISHRNEPETTPMRFISQLDSMLSGWSAPQDLSAFIRFCLNNRPPHVEAELVAILRHETNSSIIDLYETFVRVAQFAAASGDNGLVGLMSAQVTQASASINDSRLARTAFVLCGKVGALEAANASHSSGSDHERWETLAHEKVRMKDVSALPQTYRDSIIARFASVMTIADDFDESAIWLLKESLNHRLSRFASTIEEFIWRRWSDTPSDQLSVGILVFTQGTGIKPIDIAHLPTRELKSKLAGLLTRSTSLSELLIEQLSLYDLLIAEEVALSPDLHSSLSDVRRLLVEMARATMLKDFGLALTRSAELIENPDPVISVDAKRYYSHSLLQLGRTSELVNFIAKCCCKRKIFARALPVREACQLLTKQVRRSLAKDIAIPVILELHSRMVDDALNDVRNYAYEDFLLANGLTRPSELGTAPFEIDHDLLVFYLRYICIPDVMQISSEFLGTRDLEEERKNVLSLLVKLDPAFANEYETELRDITRSQLINRAVRKVERSKIYVDVPTVRRLFEKKHRETFQRYVGLMRAGIGVADPELAVTLEGVLAGKRLTQEMLEVPKNEANDLLLQMLRWLFNECTVNPEHGLDCYLSMRIRHGTLSGQLRSPLELQSLITQRAAGTDEYERNEYWEHRCGNWPPAICEQLVERLSKFSAEFDSFIAGISNDLIQIWGDEKPKGLFSISVKSVRFRLWVSDIQPDISFDRFFEGMMDLFWQSVDTSLAEVRLTIDYLLKPEVTALFSRLESDIAEFAEGIQTTDLTRAIRTAQTGTMQALDIVKDWFALSQPIAEPNFPLEDLIDVGLQCVKTIYSDFSPRIERRIPPLPPFAGALVLFSDIFFIIFSNIRRHSGLGPTPAVSIDVSSAGDRLTISTRSEIALPINSEASRGKLASIREIISHGDYQRSVRSEGGTGLIKLRKLIGRSGSEERRLEFGFEDTDIFFVTFDLGMKEIQL